MVTYEKIVAEDFELGHGSVQRTMPGGGSATGSKINLGTFQDLVGEAFAALPAASVGKGQFRTVNDSTTSTPGAIVTGSGTLFIVAWSNGTNWVCVTG